MLRCRTEYLTPLYLASEQVNTPDPSRECFWGQQIIVSWKLPSTCLYKPVMLRLHLRYGTREFASIEIPVLHKWDHWVYRLVNQDYWRQGGVISYQAELWQEDILLDQWTHHLWSELIEISEDSVCHISTNENSSRALQNI